MFAQRARWPKWLGWLRWAWVRLAKPEYQYALLGLIWSIVLWIGMDALVDPPSTLSFEIGPAITIFWAWLLVVGGALGVTATWILTGWWWIELVGCILSGTGVFTWSVVLILRQVFPHPTDADERSLLLLLFAVLVGVVLRIVKISGAQVDPWIGG